MEDKKRKREIEKGLASQLRTERFLKPALAPVWILEGYLIGYSGRTMDTLLKTRNNIEFLPQVHGFSEKVSNLSSVKIQIQELRYGPKKFFSKWGRNGSVKASSSALLELVPETKKENLEFDLSMYDPLKGLVVDLAVVGGGPAGLAVAQQVSEPGLSVCSIDPSPQLIWPNNYSVWVDEFDAMDLLDCLDTTWSGAAVYFNDKTKKDLDRPYGRVNRKQLKSKMLQKCISNGVKFHQAKVIKHPFDVDKMVFMDWRDSHLKNNLELQERNKKIPTFLYATPMIFLEETSLVARPGVPMKDIQERIVARLRHLVGGPLPVLPQRVFGIGGTAGMVHPSTGYMVARTLVAVPIVANSIVRYLGSERSISGSELSAKDLWPIERRRQRELFCFGMDILLKLDLPATRRFFDAFFNLEPHYEEFLSSRLLLPELVLLGLSLFSHASNTSRLEIIAKGTLPLCFIGLDEGKYEGNNCTSKCQKGPRAAKMIVQPLCHPFLGDILAMLLNAGLNVAISIRVEHHEMGYVIEEICHLLVASKSIE
ncbi:hypothetical protein SADUNF_Sadunf06G0028300 [Salix dunnii]|uniref:Lycopene beta-cyclase n=1 Tax=Salix dunnii TaxID=1413687 RepID=A0A835MUP1_9ROSI|nr:hypothetical protein SADUNF_Sadunf06G0028300 [Salix dunnii]